VAIRNLFVKLMDVETGQTAWHLTRHTFITVLTAGELRLAAKAIELIWKDHATVLSWITSTESVVTVGIFALLGLHLLETLVKLYWGKGNAPVGLISIAI